MNAKVKLFLIVISLLNLKCDYYDNRLTIFNNSKRAIIVEIPRFSNYSKLSEGHRYVSGEKSVYQIEMGKWEDILEKKPNKKIEIYIYDQDTLKKYGFMDSLNGSLKTDSFFPFIEKNNFYLWKKSFSLEDLIKVDWMIKITDDDLKNKKN